jgi:CDP-diacylglycerol---glycerol-3-phosphate 3-phosphatidyltransferase
MSGNPVPPRSLLNIANILTGLRIVAIPLVVVLFFLPYEWSGIAAGLTFAAAGITDSLDGYYARKYGLNTPLGEFLDPVADKLIVAVALVLIVSRNPTWWMTITAAVIIGREIAISALREWMAEIGARRKVAVSALGKFKTILQVVGLSMLLYRENILFLPIYELGVVLTVLAAVLTLWSMVAYLRAAWPDLTAGGEGA